MTTANAQAQARWRAKRNAEFQALRNSANLGQDIMLTTAEVAYLLPLLMALRNKASEPEKPQPMPEPAVDAAILRKAEDANARRLLNLQHRESLRKPDGDYFVVRFTLLGFNPSRCGYAVEQIKLITQGKYQQAMRQGSKVKVEFNNKLDRWEFDGSGLYDTWDEAAEIGRHRANEGDDVSGLDPVLARADKDELRRIRARNHPDHHADADTVLYQSAVQRLDALRNGQSEGTSP